jgi:hypothetical protein
VQARGLANAGACIALDVRNAPGRHPGDLDPPRPPMMGMVAPPRRPPMPPPDPRPRDFEDEEATEPTGRR